MEEKKLPHWLLNVNRVMKIVDDFIEQLAEKLVDEYKKNYDINDVSNFLAGVNVNRFKEYYTQMTETGLKMTGALFQSLYNELSKQELIKELNNSSDLVSILKFLEGKKVLRH